MKFLPPRRLNSVIRELTKTMLNVFKQNEYEKLEDHFEVGPGIGQISLISDKVLYLIRSYI